MPDFDKALERAERDEEQMKLLLELSRETGIPIPARGAMSKRSAAAMRGMPTVGSSAKIARALAGVGPTDPWKGQRERDYALRAGQGSTATLSLGQILAKSDGHCYLCDCELTTLTMQVEHMIPLSRGGTHSDENLAAACGSCNSRKGDRIVSFAIASRKPIYLATA